MDHNAGLLARTAPEGPAPGVLRSQKYYLSDDMLTFLVQTTLYRIHRHVLEGHTDYFNPAKIGTQAGLSDHNPIPLANVTVEQMETMLDLLYKGVQPHELPLDTSLGLLRFASHYDFARVSDSALTDATTRVNALPLAERIVLGMKHEIAEWVLAPCVELCMRAEPLTGAEGVQLGCETALMIATARERCRQRDGNNVRCETAGAVVREMLLPQV